MSSMKWRLVVARTLIAILAGNPVIMAAHGIERTLNRLADDPAEEWQRIRLQTQVAAQASRTDAQLAAGQQAAQKHSANGTQVIDIAAPSQSGVSHNQFTQFNVSADGLILNNSQGPALSALGGWTDGNRRLAGGTAQLILAEVTGTGRSALLGYTEVLGDAAEFVLANPNGISCDGCGFINTPRVVLATGVPDFLNGDLMGINISSGDVLIDGAGLNASNVNKFDILTRAMRLNAGLYADELNIRTGSNYYDFGREQVRVNANQTDSISSYQFALDASALGAMYANTISLIGTEAGLGVRSEGLINAVDSLQLTADGQLQLKDTIAGSELALRSHRADVITHGTTYGKNVNIELAGTLHNSGLIAAADNMQLTAAGLQQNGDVIAGINQQGEWLDSAEQQLHISGTAVNQGRIISQGQLEVSAKELQNVGGASMQAGATKLTTTVFDNSGTLNSTGLILDAETAQNSGHIQAQQLAINAEQFNLTDGAVYQTGTAGHLSFSGQDLRLDAGVLVAEGTAQVNASGQVHNNTNWLMADDATITAAEIINNGTLQLLAQGDLTANILNNSGNMLFATDATVSATTINNDDGQIYHSGSGEISLRAEQHLSNRDGLIIGNGSMLVSTGQFDNQQGALSAEQLKLAATNIDNRAGNVQATQLDISAQQLNNRLGSVVALGESGASLQLNIADTLDNSQGLILAKGQQLTLNSKQIINEQGSLLLSGTAGLALTATEQLRNDEGLIHSGGNLTLSTPLLSNIDGEVYADTINAAAASLDNRQGVIIAQQVALDGIDLNNSSGTIGAFSTTGKNLSLNFSHSIDNSALGVIKAAGNFAELNSGQLDNTSGSIVLAGNNGSLQISAGTLGNIQGQIQTNGELLLTGNSINNQFGYISALGDVSIAAADVNNSAGQILADKLQLTTEQLANTDGVIRAATELNLHSPLLTNQRGVISAHSLKLSSDELDNTAGQLLATAELDISTQQLTNVAGVINSQQDLLLAATELNNRSGVIQGANSFYAQVQGSIDNQDGQLLSGHNLQLHTTQLNNGQGTVVAGDQLEINATQLHNAEAGIIGANQVFIDASSLTNDALARIEGQQLQVNTALLDNAGTVLATGKEGDSLHLLADIINNHGRIESHGENLTLSNLQLDNRQGQIYHLGAGVLSIDALEQLQNQAGQLITTGRLVLQSDTLLNNAGVIEAADSISLNHRVLNNDAGRVLGGGVQSSHIASEVLSNINGAIAVDSDQLSITATTLASNSGHISVNGTLAVEAQNIDNRNGELTAGRFVLRADELNNAGGTMLASHEYGESFDISIGDTMHNELGRLLGAGQSARVNTHVLNNDGGVIALAGTDVLTVVSDNFDNATGQVSAGGQLELQSKLLQSDGQITAADINLQVAQLNNSGLLVAEQGMQIAAQQIDNSGQLAARQLIVSALDAVNSGTILASATTGESMQLNLQQLRNSGTIVSNGTTLKLNQVKLNNKGGTLLHAGNGMLSIETLDMLDNLTGAIITNGDLHLVAQQLDNNQGLLQIAGAADIDVSALNNLGGDVLALGEQRLKLTVEQLLDNSAGRIIGGQLEIDSSTLLNQAGQLAAVSESGQALAIRIADTLDNADGQISSAGQGAVITSDHLNNANGYILQTGDGSLLLQANVVDNNAGGRISSNGVLQLTARQLTNTAEIVSENHIDVQVEQLNNSGLLQADSLHLSAKELDNRHGRLLALGSDGLTLDVTGTLDNSAGFVASNGQHTVLNAAQVLNQDGDIQAQQQLTIAAKQLNNQQGRITATDAALTLQSLDNTAQGQLLAGQLALVSNEVNNNGVISAGRLNAQIVQLDNKDDGQLTASTMQLSGETLQNSGLVYADKLQLQAEQLSNSGLLQAQQQGNINAVTLLNQQGEISSGGVLSIQSELLSNIGGVLQGGQVQLSSRRLLNDDGTILALAEPGLSINVSEQLDNLNGTIYSAGEHSELNAMVLNNSGLISHSGVGSLQLQSDAVHNSGQIESAGQLQLVSTVLNNDGQLSADSLTIEGGTLSNSGVVNADQLSVKGNTLVNLGEVSAEQAQLQLQLLDNGGLLLASGREQQSLQLDAARIRNRGVIASQGENLALQLSTLDNSDGQLLHFGVGVLSIDTLQGLNNQQGQIYSGGSLALQADVLDNRNGELQAQAISLSTTQLDNRSGQVLALAQQGNGLSVEVAEQLDNRLGTIYSGGGEAVVATGSLLNGAGTIALAGSGRLAITAATIDNGAGVITSNDALRLDTQQLTSAGQLSAQELHIQADALVNHGAIEAGSLQLTADNIDNSGLMTAQQQLLLQSTALTNSGTILGKGNLTLTTTSLTNPGTLAQSGVGVLRLEVLDSLNNQSGQVISEGSMLLTAGNANNNQGLIQTEQGATIALNNLLNQDGKILAFGEQQLKINGQQTLDNTAGVIGAANMVLSTASLINSNGLLQAEQAQFNATAFNNNSGQLLSGQLLLQAGSLSNHAGLIAANDSLLLQVEQTLDNRQGEVVTTAGAANIDAGSINNDGGIISQQAGQSLQLSSSGTLSNHGGTVHGAQQLSINATALDNSGLVDAGTLTVTTDSLTNGGTIQAVNAELNSRQLVNDGLLLVTGTVGEALQLSVGDGIVNRGHIQSHGQQLVISDALNNDGGTLIHAGSGELQLAQLSNREGTVYAANALSVTGKVLNHEGLLQALGALSVGGGELDNNAGVIHNGGNLLLDVTALDNRDGELSSQGDTAELKVAGGLYNGGGTIVSTAAQLDVQAGQLVLGDGVIAGDGNLALSTMQLSLNEGGKIRAGQTLQLSTDTLVNRGLLSGRSVLLQADELDNQQGVIEAADKLQLTAGHVNNAAGTLVSRGGLSLALQGQQDGVALDNSGGQISASGVLALVTPYAVNNSAGQLLSEQQLQLQAGALNNTVGQVLAGRGLGIALNADLQNSGGILYTGQGDMTLSAQSLVNDAQGVVSQQGAGQMQLTLETLDNSGEIGAGTVLTVAAEQLNNSGLLQAATVELAAQQLRNSGYLLGDELSINSNQLDNTDGTIAALATDGVLQISGTMLNNQRGLIQSRGNSIQLRTALDNRQGEVVLLGDGRLDIGALANNQQGRILSEGAVALSGVVNNDQGVVQAAGELQLAGTAISNNAGLIHADGELDINGSSLVNQGGKISAAGSYQLAISGAIDNSLAGVLSAADTMSLAAGSLDNHSGLIYQQGDGSLLLTVDTTLNNNAGTVASNAALAVTAAELSNNVGLLQAAAMDISLGTLSNNAGVIASQGQLRLDSTGVLNNDAGRISAVADASISAGQLSNSAGRIESNHTLKLYSSGVLNNDSGNLIANNISMQLDGALNNNQGVLFAAETLSIDAASIDNSRGTLAANADVQLAVTAQLNNSQGLLQAAGNLTASAQQLDNTAGTVQAGTAQLSNRQSLNNTNGTISAQTLALSTATLNNSYGVMLATGSSDNALQLSDIDQLTNNNGTIASYGRNWSLALANLSNDNGKLLHLGSGTFTLSQTGNLTNTGTIASNANLLLNAGNVNNSGTLQAQQQLQLNAGLTNQADAVLAANNIRINAAGKAISNAGVISAGNDLRLDAASLNNSHLLYSGNNAVVKAASINNSGTWSANNLNASGFTLLQNTGRIESNQAGYTGNTLQNQGAGVLVNAGTTANSLQLNVAQLSNSGTLYNSGRDMSFGGNLSNSGSIIHAGNGSLLLGSNGTINNAGGSIASAGSATIRNSIIGAGTVYAGQGMLINSSGTFTNNSQLYTKGNLQVNSALHNQGGRLLSDGNLTINTNGSVTNTGTIQGQNLSLTSGVLNNNAGVITSLGSNNGQIKVASLSNNGGVIQVTNNNFTLGTRSGELNNGNGQIRHSGTGVLTLDSAGNLNQQSGLVQSSGQLVLNAQGNLDNSHGVLSAGHYRLTGTGTLTNNNGQIIGTGDGSNSIQSGTLLNRNGHIAANGSNLTLNSAALDNNNGSILLAGSGDLTISATSVANDAVASRIISNGAIGLNGGTGLNNAGVISAANLFTLTAGNISNDGTLASRAGKVDIDSSGTLTNSGTLTGAGAVDVDVRTLSNASGKVQSDGTVDIAANSLSAGQIYGRDLLLSSDSSIVLQSGEQLSAGRNLQLQTSGNITNSGNITASGTLDLDATELSNNAAGVIRAGGNAVLDLNKLTNKGIISSNGRLTLDVVNTNNSGTLAAASHLDVNGNVSNSNLLFAGNLLTIDGNVSNSGNIYANLDAIISGATVTNSGGTIAAARDLSISGTILNDHTGTVEFVDGAVTTRKGYVGGDPDYDYDQNGPRKTVKVTSEKRTTTTYSAELSGTAGVIAAGRDMYLDGHITNNYSTISAGNNLALSGTDFIGRSASNQQVHQVEVYEQSVVVGCLVGITNRGCAEPGPGYAGDPILVDEYTETTYTGGSIGTVYAGSGISGSLKDKVALTNASPLNGNLVSGISTSAAGSSGSAARGNSTGASSSGTVVVNRGSGNANNTGGANRTASGVTAGGSGTVNAAWRDNNVSHSGVQPGSRVDDVAIGPVADATARQLDTLGDAGQTVANNTALQGRQQQVNQTGSVTLQTRQQAERGTDATVGATLQSQHLSDTGTTVVQVDKLSGRAVAPLQQGEARPDIVQQQGKSLNGAGPGTAIPQTAQQQAGATTANVQRTAKASADRAGDPMLDTAIADGSWQLNRQDLNTTVSGDNRRLNADTMLQDVDISTDAAQRVVIQGGVRQLQLTEPTRRQADALQADVAVQNIGFMSPDLAANMQLSSGDAPQLEVTEPGQQQGGGLVGNGNITGSSGDNPDLIIKGQIDKQQATLAQQQSSAQGNRALPRVTGQSADQSAGQNVFITDEQMRVLTEDLGFDADAINKGQQTLYAAINQNDLLADGVTLSSGGVIDITADAGFNIDSGIAAGDGLILRSDAGLNMGNFGFLDSDKLLGLQLGGDFTNKMTLQSDTLWLDIGGDFTNLGRLTGSDVLSINAGNDLINQSLLSGGQVQLNAGGDIINRTEFSQHTVQDGKNSTTYTTVGKAPQIVSGDSLSMTAGNNIDLQGSKLSAAGDIGLNAANDVLLGAVEKLSGHEKYFKGGHDIELDRSYDVVSLEAGGNLSVVAGNNLQSEGAQFSAGGIAALTAANDMNLLAVVESHYDADKTTKKSTFKKKVIETVSRHEEVQGTAITAGNILLNATVDAAGNVAKLPGGNITLEGGELNAEQNIMAFGKDITLTAGTYQDYDYSHTSKSSFGGLKSNSREELAQDDLLAGSTLTAGGNIQLDAGNNLNILASGLEGDNIGLTAFNEVLIASGEESSIRESRTKSGGFFSGGSLFSSSETLTGLASVTADSSVINAGGNIVIDAGSATVIGSALDADRGIQVSTDIGDIQVLAAKETTETYSHEQTISVSIGGGLKALSRPDELVKSEDGQLKISLASATYDKVDFAGNATSHKGSELNAGDGISLDSVADVLIEGSAVSASDTVNLLADGDVLVKEAEDSYSETREEVHGSAEISVVVQHQAVEVAKAVIAVDKAKDQVKQAEADYRKYRKEKDQLENTLAQLEADYAAGAPGVNHGDIVELKNLLDDVKGDEAWYLAGIATATANVVSKVTLLVQQTAAAAQSSATYGFNAGVQLDIAASKTDSSLDATSSLASNISGDNINIVTGGDGKSGNTLIQGSALNATQSLNIYTGELNVLASQDTQRSETDTQSGNLTIAQTVWGAAGGPTVSAGFNSSQQQDKQTTHNNSSLTADKLNIVTNGDANIIGGNLHGTTAVNMAIGGDLTLESVQDRFSGSNKGFGVSGGFGFGGDSSKNTGKSASTSFNSVGDTSKGVSSVNGGLNASNGRYQSTETLLSSITGGTVDMTVDGHTQLTGALIAAMDTDGKDTGQLSLNTGSLTFTDLTNRSYSSNQSIGVNASVGVSNAANPADPNQSDTDLTLNSSNYSYRNENSQSLDKTLATIGQGSLTVGGENVGGEDASPDGLNRDVDAIDKEIYSVDRQQGNIELTVDHRLLSEDGRKQIAEDVKRTEILGESIVDVAKNDSVSITGGGEGESSLREHIGNKQTYFTATKNFVLNGENAGHMATLSNDNATPQQKEAAYNALASAIATEMGVEPAEAKVLMENDPQFAGAYSRDTDVVYVNDLAHNNATEAVNTVGHETQHYLDNQQNPDAVQSDQYEANREEYAGIMGDATADYLGFNFAQSGSALVNGNNHSLGSSNDEKSRNEGLVAGNNAAYSTENPDALDHRRLTLNEARTLDKVRNVIQGNSSLSAEEKQVAHLQLNALACAAVECANGVSETDPLYKDLQALQQAGESLQEQGMNLSEILGEDAAGQFTHGWRDEFNDALTRNDDALTVVGGVVQTAAGVAGVAGGVAMTVGGAVGCAPSAGLTCLAVPAGATVTALSQSEVDAGLDKVLGDYTHTEGLGVTQSLSGTTHQGDVSPDIELLKDAGVVGLEILAAKVGGKVLDKVVDKYQEVKVVEGSQNGEIDFYQGVDNANSGPLVDYVQLSKQTNLSPETLEDIIMTPKGKRPEPSEYMTQTQIDEHLTKFDEGAIRFTSKSGIEDYGTLGPDGGFVMPKSEFDSLVVQANGDLRVVEEKLGLSKGYLDGVDTVIVHIEQKDLNSLRVPSGNESGANSNWRPGGQTSGGISEAVVDFSKKPPYTVIELNGGYN
ncbi:hemagglutinin repeat-containing protein [Shewanella salipaludis]|uniref:Filamentous hemagglutinin N-terminal domain-containing protein n=1 Tax=Shewanella salipaludis TaxID=2723052 RepID=A0A972G3R8_9GAMM|nr:hemagglutinin repeat-containing protein [Shewanella salipaludis]NMH66674.1 filamentous hemagglutinin N-terminal domain-containing protein [Shewanella salipaludis]